MAFSGKKPGLNNTDRKDMRKMIDRGYAPQEISDRLQLGLKPVLSHYQVMTGLSDEEMEKFSLVDKSTATAEDAAKEAERIIREAKEEAERIRSEALEDVENARELLEDAEEALEED